MPDTTPDPENSAPADTVGNPQQHAAAGASTSRDNDADPAGAIVESPQDDESRVGTRHDPGTDPADRDDTRDDDDRGELDDDRQTFDRPYVERLRRESADHRRRAREAEGELDGLRSALWHERVARLDLLADPADLPLDADLLDDPDGIRAAAEQLLAERPHLRTRRIRERIGQGEGSATSGVSLSALLRRQA